MNYIARQGNDCIKSVSTAPPVLKLELFLMFKNKNENCTYGVSSFDWTGTIYCLYNCCIETQ